MLVQVFQCHKQKFLSIIHLLLAFKQGSMHISSFELDRGFQQDTVISHISVLKQDSRSLLRSFSTSSLFIKILLITQLLNKKVEVFFTSSSISELSNKVVFISQVLNKIVEVFSHTLVSPAFDQISVHNLLFKPCSSLGFQTRQQSYLSLQRR